MVMIGLLVGDGKNNGGAIMNLNTDILRELNEIYNNREEAAYLEDMFRNFKQGRAILLIKAKTDKSFCMNDYEVVLNSVDDIPQELLDRLVKTVRDYMNEQYGKIAQVQISNLPFGSDE